MARVSTELAEQLESSQENGLVAACRQKVLLSTIEASKAVEEQICRRSAATSHQSLKRLSGQQKKVSYNLITYNYITNTGEENKQTAKTANAR